MTPSQNARFIPLVLLLLFFVSSGVGLITPLLDDTAKASSDSLKGAALTGHKIYRDEGCAFCHTQQVRAVAADLDLGPVSSSGSAREMGLARVGPDIACYADRTTPDDIAEDFAARGKVSKRPFTKHLSDDDLKGLAAYLKSLTCGGAK